MSELSQSAPESSPPVFRPQKFQISTQATQDDPIYFVSEEALHSLFSFFTVKLIAKCCFCGKDYDAESLSFKRQGHAVSVNMSCLCGDYEVVVFPHNGSTDTKILGEHEVC